jgi:hypothetical protein
LAQEFCSYLSTLYFFRNKLLDLWLKKEKATGDYQALTQGRRGRRLKIQDPEKFREFVRKTERKPKEKWLNCGEKS